MARAIAANGMIWGRKDPLLEPVDYTAFVGRLIEALGRDKEEFRETVERAGRGVAARRAFGFRPRNLNDPNEVGWALVLPPRDPSTEAIADALKPLVDHRQGQVIFSDTPLDADLHGWITRNYTYRPERERPYYILIAASPTAAPFRFQYNLDAYAAVGRLAFDDPQGHAAYAEKVVRLETQQASTVERRAAVFATDHSLSDVTHISRKYMADPIVQMLQNDGVPVTYLPGDQATLGQLKKAASQPQTLAPALLYTATHGAAVDGQDEALRRSKQGALICQDYDGLNGAFSADEVPAGEFLHGGVLMAFACYGAGTPKHSDFFHWIHDPSLTWNEPERAFAAALPTKLLAHPKGPVAFYGHIDPAWLFSFDDPTDLGADKTQGARMRPFREAVSLLFQGATVGYAVSAMNEVYATYSISLADMEDQLARDPSRRADDTWAFDLVDTWMTRNDTQNFVVLGDPAVKLGLRED